MYCRVTMVGELVRSWKKVEKESTHISYENLLRYQNMMSKERANYFIKVKVWGKTGALAIEHAPKGSYVLVEGVLEGSEKMYGHYYYHVNVHNIVFLNAGVHATSERFKPANIFEQIDSGFKIIDNDRNDVYGDYEVGAKEKDENIIYMTDEDLNND